MIAKRILIEALGSGAQHEVAIEPSTRAADVLTSIGLTSEVAWLELDDPQRLLAPDENVFHMVQPGQKLHVTPKMDVAA